GRGAMAGARGCARDRIGIPTGVSGARDAALRRTFTHAGRIDGLCRCRPSGGAGCKKDSRKNAFVHLRSSVAPSTRPSWAHDLRAKRAARGESSGMSFDISSREQFREWREKDAACTCSARCMRINPVGVLDEMQKGGTQSLVGTFAFCAEAGATDGLLFAVRASAIHALTERRLTHEEEH